MIALWIVLAIVALLTLLILFGSVRLRIVCREKLRVTAGIGPIRISLISDKKKKKTRPLIPCRDPDAVLRKERKRQRKAERRAEKKRLRAEKKKAKKAARKQQTKSSQAPNPNLKENLDMILALLKRLYRKTRGKVKIHVRSMHICVGTNDAAKTALLYGVILQSTSYILNFIERKFTHIAHRQGDISIVPDYLSEHTSADIDIAISIRLHRVLRIGFSMLIAFVSERRVAKDKALLRVLKQKEKSKKRKS